MSVYPSGHLLQCNDVEYLYTQFIDIIFDIVSRSVVVVTFFNHNFVNCKATLILAIKINVPSKTVVLGPKDPEYITPLIKSLKAA